MSDDRAAKICLFSSPGESSAMRIRVCQVGFGRALPSEVQSTVRRLRPQTGYRVSDHSDSRGGQRIGAVTAAANCGIRLPGSPVSVPKRQGRAPCLWSHRRTKQDGNRLWRPLREDSPAARPTDGLRGIHSPIEDAIQQKVYVFVHLFEEKLRGAETEVRRRHGCFSKNCPRSGSVLPAIMKKAKQIVLDCKINTIWNRTAEDLSVLNPP